MYKLLFIFFTMILFASCGMPMFDFAENGSINRSIYYDVALNQVIINKKDTLNSMSLRKYINDSTYLYEEIIPVPASKTFTISKLKDSIALYDFEISFSFKNDHFRMGYDLYIDKELVKKKKRINCRFTSH